MDKNNKYLPQAKAQIKTWHENGIDWETIKSGHINEVTNFFEFARSVLCWNLSDADWLEIIDDVKDVIENSKPAFIGRPQVPLKDIPTNEMSSWQLYKKTLEKNHFSDLSIERIEKSSQRIISQLNDKTKQEDPVRGMVVGNVQSGKTASMAGVISMAADYGYNFFIVLTGTIDSLREQTQKRLIKDLKQPGENVFMPLYDLAPNCEYSYRLENLNLGANDNIRYLYVCLKNPTRLDNLLAWINSNQQVKKNLKIVLLDDEADQASINTANMDEDEITRINNQIKALTFSRAKKMIKSGVFDYETNAEPYGAMNYIGYTATPYANFLNEANDKSLYPTNFISTLISPEEYIGPQQIFGIDDVNDGLPIINIIEDPEIKAVNKKLSKEFDDLSKHELSKALAWFICTVACFRHWELKQPASMLIHTSQKIVDHSAVAEIVESIIKQFKKSIGISFIKTIYEAQKKKLNKEKFLEVMTEFPKDRVIKDYPDFERIKPYIEELIALQTKHISLSEDGTKLEYTKGLHLCIDNCKNGGADEEGNVLRIIYPDKINYADILDYSPAFIVVGGSTLSRGLTLEGLTTSYFIRSTGAADTLMQMGRWFGFRRNYELLERIWLSSKAKTQFEFLTILDYDLREELKNMETMNMSPTEYGPRIDTFPNFKMLKITATKKSQKMIYISNDYANKKGQTTKFFDDDRIIKTNYFKAYDFVKSLGPVDKERIKKLDNKFSKGNALIWFDCDYNKVIDLVCSLEYPKENKSALLEKNKEQEIKQWFKNQIENKYLNNFNVIVASNDKKDNLPDGEIKIHNYSIFLPTRRRLKSSVGTDYIDTKILTEPNDKLMDIDETLLTFDERHEFEDDKTLNPSEKRIKFNMNNTPLLVLYFINKDSGCNEKDTEDRVALKLPQHLVGYHLFIPYGNNGKPKAKMYECAKVSVDLEFLRGDKDEANEN